MKTCWKCKGEKTSDLFGKDAKRFDGKNPMCKACVKAASAEYRVRNAESRKQTVDKYRETNIEKCRAAHHAWYEKDPDRARGVKRQWASKNNEKSRAIKAKWRAENYEKRVEIGAARRGAVGSHTGEQVKSLMRLQKFKCANCKESLKAGYHEDHVVPLKLGGDNYITNIQLLCPFCNLSKGALHPVDFAQREGRLL